MYFKQKKFCDKNNQSNSILCYGLIKYSVLVSVSTKMHELLLILILDLFCEKVLVVHC